MYAEVHGWAALIQRRRSIPPPGYQASERRTTYERRERHDQRSHPSDPGRAACRSDHLRREGSGHEVSADRAVAAAEGRAQCADRAPRRRRLCRVERVRRPDPHADRRAPGQERPQVQPLPHDRAVLADATGAADRPQSPLGEHGRHLRDRDLGARLHARCCRRTRRRWP